MSRAAVIAASVVVASAAGWWALAGVDRAELGDALTGVDTTAALAATAVYLGVFYAAEIAGFLVVYRRHLVAEVPSRDVAVVVAGKHLLGAVSPLLTKAVAPLYFRRRWSVPVLRTVGASELVGFADVLSTLLLLSASLLVGGARLPAPLALAFGVWWLVVVLYAVWAWTPTVRPSRLREAKLLQAFARTTPRELAVQVALRLAVGLGALVLLHQILAELGHSLAPGRLVLLGSLLLFTSMLPIAVGGYGGPQGVAVLLLVEAWDVMGREDALAVSLLWSTLFTLGRVAVGVPLALPLLRLTTWRWHDDRHEAVPQPG